MSVDTKSILPWRIEAFREYLTFETLQQAAAVLIQYEGEAFDIRNPRIVEMQNLLVRRTGKAAWVPNRSGSQDIDWNVEGDVTRNKGRVFTSMLILRPKEWRDGTVSVTKFGQALGSGRIDRNQYYDFILTKFKYPHPAWKDNWDAWTGQKRELFPFIYILQALLALHEIDPNQSYLSTEEVADYLHKDPSHAEVPQFAQNIVKARYKKIGPITERSDAIHRKISDVLGFLCLTPYCYFDGHYVRLNLFDVHVKEKSHFWLKRKDQSKFDMIYEIVNSVRTADMDAMQ